MVDHFSIIVRQKFLRIVGTNVTYPSVKIVCLTKNLTFVKEISFQQTSDVYNAVMDYRDLDETVFSVYVRDGNNNVTIREQLYALHYYTVVVDGTGALNHKIIDDGVAELGVS